jgi:putative transcriptional regulator
LLFDKNSYVYHKFKLHTMAIIVNLDVMLARRKMKLNELSKIVGVNVSNLSILKSGRAKSIRFSTLDAICEALKCQPGNILEYVKEEE